MFFINFYRIFRQPKDIMEKILSEYNRFDDSSNGVHGPLYEAIEMLRSNFLDNKEVDLSFKSICTKMALSSYFPFFPSHHLIENSFSSSLHSSTFFILF